MRAVLFQKKNVLFINFFNKHTSHPYMSLICLPSLSAVTYTEIKYFIMLRIYYISKYSMEGDDRFPQGHIQKYKTNIP